ncbi:hypothetical protein [Spongorhabdus nitratireducens]
MKLTTKITRFVLCALMVAGSSSLLAQENPLQQLSAMNDRWPVVFAEKNTKALPELYSADALMAQYPYAAANNLHGVKAITGMFEGGPFQLKEGVVRTWTQAIQYTETTGLIIKQWQLTHASGAFSGFAIKVAKHTDQWRWDVEISGGGLQDVSGFATRDYEVDNSAFGHLSERIFDFKSSTKVDNLLAIKNTDRGLLLVKLTEPAGNSRLVIIATEKVKDSWQAATRFEAEIKYQG